MHRYVVGPNCVEQHSNDTSQGRRAFRRQLIYGAGLSTLVAPYSIFRSPSEDHVVLLTRTGGGSVKTENGEWLLIPGSICLLPNGLTYTYETTASWEKAWFHLAPSDRWDRLASHPYVRTGGDWKEISTLLELFFLERTRGTSSASCAVLDSFAHSTSLLIERELMPDIRTRDLEVRMKLDRMRQHLYRNPGDDWSVDHLAEQFGVSPRHLQTLVKTHFGSGVMEMVTQVRIEAAASLLLTTNWKLEAVAHRVGYQNVFAFSRAFKRFHGMSPQQYRTTSPE